MRLAFVIVFTVILVAVVLGIILLQIHLSKNRSKWLGLILPGICLIISLFVVFGMTLYIGFDTTQTETVVVDKGSQEFVIEVPITSSQKQPTFNLSSKIFSIAIIFFLYNISTVILVLIHFFCRKRINKCREINKMKIQDLECYI